MKKMMMKKRRENTELKSVKLVEYLLCMFILDKFHMDGIYTHGLGKNLQGNQSSSNASFEPNFHFVLIKFEKKNFILPY